jgi:hypothetical protein
MIKVLYYYYYLFYKNVLKDNEPHLLTTLALSFSLSLLINGILNIIFAHLLSFAFSRWEMFGLLALILLIFYVTLHRTGKAQKIVDEQPKFFNSHKLSIVITIIFFLITTSFLFWEAGYVGSVLGTR